MLVSETHFFSRSYYQLRGYDVHLSNHLADSHRGGSAIIIKSCLKYDQFLFIEHQTAQCVAIKVRTDQGEIVIASIYCSPNSPLTANHYEELLSELRPNFIIAGDWNAHHRLWGSRKSTIRGRTLADIILASHMQVFATGGSTHYPYSQRMPSAID